MRILTYAASINDDAPERYRCAARILLKDGSLHPLVIHAPTKAEARERAEAWWAEQLNAERERLANRERRTEAMRAARGRAA